MTNRYPLLIAGSPSSDSSLEVTAPYDGAPIATLDTANEAAVDHALATAHGLYRDRSRWMDAERVSTF